MTLSYEVADVDKLIAIDLDGTLVRADNTVSPACLAAIERACHERAAVVIVTGRPYISADALCRRIGLLSAPLATFNGGLIQWPEQGQILRHCPVPADAAAEVVELCRSEGLHLHYYLDDIMYVSQDNEWARLYCRRTELSCQEEQNLTRFAGRSPHKLLAIDQPDRIAPLYDQYKDHWDGRLYVTRSMPEYLEFLSPEATKGRALRWLRDFYQVPATRTCAIGDALNDLPLLEEAAFAAAMPDAPDPLKRVASFMPTQADSGVAEAIEWFLEECESTD